MIHDACKREKMTQQELAEREGTTKSYISRIETGNVEPSAGFCKYVTCANLFSR
ncbi:MAG: helix-turn-helix transcriptional regulator [Bacteroidales bacterium]|nr:helix-turn-helix transcriptional regulator [Bacteroidales bacterium]